MNSTELLKLIQNCPSGAETLVTRIIYILTKDGKGNEFPVLVFCTYFFD